MTTGIETPKGEAGPLELEDVVFVKMADGSELAFDVVGILDDPDDGSSYVVLLHESDGAEPEWVVVTREAVVIEDGSLAQTLLDEFLAFAETISGDDLPDGRDKQG